jgi:hypothetical protein
VLVTLTSTVVKLTGVSVSLRSWALDVTDGAVTPRAPCATSTRAPVSVTGALVYRTSEALSETTSVVKLTCA